MQRITTIETTSQHDPAGCLYGPSQRFGVRTFLDRGRNAAPLLISSLSTKRRQDAREDARTWAAAQRGCMALAYNRESGLVAAQYYHDQHGTLGALVYSPRGVLIEVQHLELFEEASPLADTQGPAVPETPLTTEALSCLFPIVDETAAKHAIYMGIRPSFSGVFVTVYRELPGGDLSDGESIMAGIKVDLFDGRLSVLSWDTENLDGDPHKVVLVEDVSTWKPHEAQREDDLSAASPQ